MLKAIHGNSSNILSWVIIYLWVNLRTITTLLCSKSRIQSVFITWLHSSVHQVQCVGTQSCHYSSKVNLPPYPPYISSPNDNWCTLEDCLFLPQSGTPNSQNCSTVPTPFLAGRIWITSRLKWEVNQKFYNVVKGTGLLTQMEIQICLAWAFIWESVLNDDD